MVTAEAATVLPVLTLVSIALVWVISVGITQVRVVDAARDAARVLARGDDASAARDAVRRTAGRSARLDVDRGQGLVTVQVEAPAHPPGWLLVPLPDVTLHAQAVVEVEDAQPGS